MVISKQPRNDRQENEVVMVSADRDIDRRILLEADSLEKAGWRVTVVGMAADSEATEVDPRIVRVGRRRSTTPRMRGVLNDYRLIRRRLPMNSRLKCAFKSLAWHVLVDQETFFLKLYSDVLCTFSPHVFVAHDLPMLPVATYASRRCRSRLVYDSHELYCEQEFSNRLRARWKKIETKHIRSCDAVMTINPSIAAEIKRRYSLDRVHVIYNAERSGLKYSRNTFFHETFRLKTDDKVLLFQGGLSAGRNLEKLVEAMVHVRSPVVHLVIMGDGRLGATLAKKIIHLRLSHRVHLHPAVSQKELLTITAGADAGVIPYQATCLNNYYCTPNKLFEFIAAGIPILASDLPEIRRIIEAHNIGMLADLSSAEQTARSIDYFFSDAQRFRTWQRQVEKTRAEISWEREAEKLVAIFEDLR